MVLRHIPVHGTCSCFAYEWSEGTVEDSIDHLENWRSSSFDVTGFFWGVLALHGEVPTWQHVSYDCLAPLAISVYSLSLFVLAYRGLDGPGLEQVRRAPIHLLLCLDVKKHLAASRPQPALIFDLRKSHMFPEGIVTGTPLASQWRAWIIDSTQAAIPKMWQDDEVSWFLCDGTTSKCTYWMDRWQQPVKTNYFKAAKLLPTSVMLTAIQFCDVVRSPAFLTSWYVEVLPLGRIQYHHLTRTENHYFFSGELKCFSFFSCQWRFTTI